MSEGSEQLPCLADIQQAHERIRPYIHRTPVFTSTTADARCERKAFFKCENLQKTGSFKARGALNAVLRLKEKSGDKSKVITHSSGNHAQALAWAANMAGIPCTVVVPNNTPITKINAMKSYGANVVLCEPTVEGRKGTCDRLAAEQGATYISSCDHFDIVSGQGTIALEFLEDVPDLDAVLVPVSGGGMVSGIATAGKAIRPQLKVFAVEAKGKDLERSLKAGERLWPNPPQMVDTIAEGIRLQQLGHLPWLIALKLVEKDVFTVDNEAIIEGMKFSFERMKLVIEGASGAGVAALFSDRLKKMSPDLLKVGVILCGGNLDLDHLPWVTSNQ
ncbi:uncharacterized protein LOC135468512 [Liolophura sinensis]|uniref:uncharacterized protein LOC135468512 n=1 Tax=Liolophura sinensis TaxID=3198878 RepID=UPI0031596412